MPSARKTEAVGVSNDAVADDPEEEVVEESDKEGDAAGAVTFG